MVSLGAVVPSWQAPVVQVTVPAGAVRAGSRISVTGHARDGFSWPVRGGQRVFEGSQLVLGDALAPINTPVTYRLTVPGQGTEISSEPVTRPWAGRSLLTDVVGGGPVDLIWQGDDARTPDQRVTAHEVPGRATPVMVFAPVMGAGTVQLTARTSGADTRAMAALAARPTVVALFHNPARCFQCRRGVCDVPLTTVMALSSVSHARTHRADAAERAWSLKGSICSVPEPQRVIGVSTWDDLDAASLRWARVEAMSLTWDTFDRVIWQGVR